MIIDRFQEFQAEEVAELIKRNLLEIASKYYPPEYVASLVEGFSPANLIKKAETQHNFVAAEEGKVVGTGSLTNYGSEATPGYYGTAIFVAPEHHGKGIGRQIMRKVEARAFELEAEKITVRAAINARAFYEKPGYTYRDGVATRDERGNYVMEKAVQHPA